MKYFIKFVKKYSFQFTKDAQKEIDNWFNNFFTALLNYNLFCMLKKK